MGVENEKSLLFVYSSAVVAVLWYAALLWRSRKSKHLALPPGPAGLPLVGSLPFLDPQLHTYFSSLAATYGPILSIKLGLKLGIVITSPSLAREVLRDHDPIFANRDVPAAARVFAYGGSDIVWSSNGPTWRMLRKVCVREVLGGHTLDAVYGLRRREMRATVQRVRERERAGKTVDVGAEMFLTVLNVMTSMLWGSKIEEEGGGGGEELGEEFRVLVGKMTEILGQPNVSDFFPVLERFDLQGVEKKSRVLMERFDRIFERIISARTSGGGKDFLEVMLRMEEEGDDGKTPFTMANVKALLMDMVVGGTDTTSTTLEWAMAEMMNRPETMKKAQEEIDAVIGKDGVVEESDAPKLPYLGAVIKEVLRLHPVLPLLVPHCPSEPCPVGSYTIPQGARVFVNVWAIHRDPSNWEDPSVFRPERFLGGDVARWDYSGNDLGYFPFGSGRRICAGIGMAERMVTYALASLLHSFDWSTPEGENLDMAEKFGIVLKKAVPLVATPTPRLSKPELYD